MRYTQLLYFTLLLDCHADGSRGGGFYLRLYVCLSVLPARYFKHSSPNLTQKCSKMIPENPFIFGEKVTSRTNIAGEGLCTLVGAGFF